ncbi:hypothetical protein ACI2KX_18830 [Ectopseudomonas khazarica]|uniref:hypothetical protein n=1 Tax=Ectopseudomonas khazarica TaxID=2502979 RepID=UPI00384A4EF1
MDKAPARGDEKTGARIIAEIAQALTKNTATNTARTKIGHSHNLQPHISANIPAEIPRSRRHA